MIEKETDQSLHFLDVTLQLEQASGYILLLF